MRPPFAAYKERIRNKSQHVYLDGVFVVLLGAEEERAVHQRVPVEHEHEIRAQDAVDSRLVLGRQRRQDEQSGLVVAVIALVLDLRDTKRKIKRSAFSRREIGARQNFTLSSSSSSRYSAAHGWL